MVLNKMERLKRELYFAAIVNIPIITLIWFALLFITELGTLIILLWGLGIEQGFLLFHFQNILNLKEDIKNEK